MSKTDFTSEKSLTNKGTYLKATINVHLTVNKYCNLNGVSFDSFYGLFFVQWKGEFRIMTQPPQLCLLLKLIFKYMCT